MADIRSLVDTIVLVMMENRSFDHVLGFLSHESFDGRSDIDGLHRPSTNFDWSNADTAGNLYPPTVTPDGYLPCDLPHSREQIGVALQQGGMNGFIQAYFASQSIDQSPAPMRFCNPDDVPVTAALARNYCVCDRWFAALPADTQPNRLMALSGYSLIDSTDGVKPPFHLLPEQRTFFDWLSSKGTDFRIYVDAGAIDDVGPPSVLLLMESQWGHVIERASPLDRLTTDWAGTGAAPAFIYCEPFYNDFATVLGLHGSCNHAPLPMAYGEAFLGKVYTALTSNPAKWARTMLVICSDEHGGFFDHATPPPMTTNPPAGHKWLDPSPMSTVGVRVPGIVVSPLVEQGSSFHGQLDHTSILQLLVERFGAPSDLASFGVAAQRKSSGVASLASVLTLAAPRNDIIQLPSPPPQPPQRASTSVNTMGRMFQGVMADRPATRQPPAT